MDTIDIVVKRITEMESILEEALSRMDKAEAAPKALLVYQSQIKKLDEYYSSQDWKDDFAMDEVTFTTKPEVMKVGYELYKRMGFEEVGEKDGIVSMRMSLLRME